MISKNIATSEAHAQCRLLFFEFSIFRFPAYLTLSFREINDGDFTIFVLSTVILLRTF